MAFAKFNPCNSCCSPTVVPVGTNAKMTIGGTHPTFMLRSRKIGANMGSVNGVLVSDSFDYYDFWAINLIDKPFFILELDLTLKVYSPLENKQYDLGKPHKVYKTVDADSRIYRYHWFNMELPACLSYPDYPFRFNIMIEMFAPFSKPVCTIDRINYGLFSIEDSIFPKSWNDSRCSFNHYAGISGYKREVLGSDYVYTSFSTNLVFNYNGLRGGSTIVPPMKALRSTVPINAPSPYYQKCNFNCGSAFLTDSTYSLGETFNTRYCKITTFIPEVTKVEVDFGSDFTQLTTESVGIRLLDWIGRVTSSLGTTDWQPVGDKTIVINPNHYYNIDVPNMAFIYSKNYEFIYYDYPSNIEKTYGNTFISNIYLPDNLYLTFSNGTNAAACLNGLTIQFQKTDICGGAYLPVTTNSVLLSFNALSPYNSDEKVLTVETDCSYTPMPLGDKVQLVPGINNHAYDSFLFLPMLNLGFKCYGDFGYYFVNFYLGLDMDLFNSGIISSLNPFWQKTRSVIFPPEFSCRQQPLFINDLIGQTVDITVTG